MMSPDPLDPLDPFPWKTVSVPVFSGDLRVNPCTPFVRCTVPNKKGNRGGAETRRGQNKGLTQRNAKATLRTQRGGWFMDRPQCGPKPGTLSLSGPLRTLGDFRVNLFIICTCLCLPAILITGTSFPSINEANARHAFCRAMARQKFLGGNLKGNFLKCPLSRRRLF